MTNGQIRAASFAPIKGFHALHPQSRPAQYNPPLSFVHWPILGIPFKAGAFPKTGPAQSRIRPAAVGPEIGTTLPLSPDLALRPILNQAACAHRATYAGRGGMTADGRDTNVESVITKNRPVLRTDPFSVIGERTSRAMSVRRAWRAFRTGSFRRGFQPCLVWSVVREAWVAYEGLLICIFLSSFVHGVLTLSR